MCCIFCFCNFALISGALCLLPVSLPRALNSEKELLQVAAAAAATRVAGQALLAGLAGSSWFAKSGKSGQSG